MTVTPAPQRPVEPIRTLPRDSGPLTLYAGALRHLAGRAAVLLSTAALRLGRWATTETRETTRDRAVEARHPSTRARLTVAATGPGSVQAGRDLIAHLSVVPDGYAQGRADLQFTHHAGHGASEGDPDL